MVKHIGILTAVFVLIFSAAVEAKNLYVDQATGNDSVTYEANSSSNPWRTIGRAAWGSTSRSAPNSSQAARAGDTVIVREGTYSTTGTGLRYDPAYNPINTGMIGSPIVFQAEGTVVLTQTGQGPVIGANGNNGARNYITWSGFTIYEINALATSDTGPVVLWSTTGSRIENCIIDGYDNGRLGNNHNGIRIENTTNVVLRNNRIYNVLNFGSRQMNGAGIMSYFSSGALIENNEIYNCGAGIFIKGGDNANFIVRYNYVYDTAHGILIQYTSASGEHRIYQNIVRTSEFGIHVRLNSHNVKVVNNTLINNNCGISVIHWQEPVSNILVQNNIVSQGADEVINGGEFTAVNQLSIDRNNYYSSMRWSINGVAYNSLSSWRSALGGCPGAGNECSSITSNPQFVNSSAGDYRLQAGSPTRTIGVDILNLSGGGASAIIPAGAYITGNETIGRTGGATPPPPPSPSPGGTIAPPSGLRIQ